MSVQFALLEFKCALHELNKQTRPSCEKNGYFCAVILYAWVGFVRFPCKINEARGRKHCCQNQQQQNESSL